LFFFLNADVGSNKTLVFFNLRYRRKMTVFVRLLRFTHYHSILQFISVGAQITATHYDVVTYIYIYTIMTNIPKIFEIGTMLPRIVNASSCSDKK
jgi:hypothetical protein